MCDLDYSWNFLYPLMQQFKVLMFTCVSMLNPHDRSIMQTPWGKWCNQIFNQGLLFNYDIEKKIWSNQGCTDWRGHIYILNYACGHICLHVVFLMQTDTKLNIYSIFLFLKGHSVLSIFKCALLHSLYVMDQGLCLGLGHGSISNLQRVQCNYCS